MRPIRIVRRFAATIPLLSSPSGVQTGATTADLSVVTDIPAGTLYWIVSISSTPPSAAQIKAGQDSSGSAAADADSVAVEFVGTQSASANGLTASTTYYAHFLQTATVSDSQTATSASFTTDISPVLAISGTAPDAELGTPYSWTPTAVGGTPPYAYSIAAGSLPAWATLNASTGEITGTPA